MPENKLPDNKSIDNRAKRGAAPQGPKRGAAPQGPPQALWSDFAASGRVADYLLYREAVNRANADGASKHANTDRGPGAVQQRDGGKRPPDHGAF